jgi:caa(3)-type oxidase subunit IV
MSAAQHHSDDASHGEGHHTNYVKVWALLVVLLIISIIGPELGHPVITLVTAFGIAVVKAYLVATKFMHVDLEPKLVTYFVVTCLGFMLLFFAGVAPDVLKHDGANWTNVAAKAASERAAADGAAAKPVGH